jgi:two-component system CheB/CheR fusion protein
MADRSSVANGTGIGSGAAGEIRERAHGEAAGGNAEAIVDSICSPLAVLGKGQRIISANSAFYALFATDAASVIGRPLAATAARRLDASALQALIDGDEAAGEPIDAVDFTIALGTRTFAVAASRMHDRAVGNILLVLHDISAFRRTERVLVEAGRVAELANLTKSRFLAAASHDLRQPLQTLSLLHGALRQQLADREALAALTSAERTCASMRDTLGALLDLDRLERGAMRPNLDEFPLHATFDPLDAEFAPLAQAKGVEWRRVECGLFIRSDRLLLETMVRNLLANAVRYTDRGRILLGARRRGDRLRIEVWDTGVGIPARQLPHVFDEYHRAPDADQRGGLGLGLAIVQSFAELLGYAIGVRSRIGKGSVFAIEVPLVDRAPARRKAPAAARRRTPLGIAGHVLVIENEAAVREAVETLLVAQGHRVTAHANTPSARGAIASGLRPDLIISSYNLPGDLTGAQNATALRAMIGPRPVLILTGDTREVTMRDIVRNGCAAMAKPAKPDELAQAVARMLREAAAAASPLPPHQSAERDARPMIAIVDDDRDTRAATQLLLGRAGYRVRNFADAQAFIDAYRSSEVTCLIADVRMPGMNGLEMLARLAAAGDIPPAIIISGQADIGMAVEAMRAGAVDFIEKPAFPETLLTAVERALRLALNPAERSAARTAAAMRLAALTRRERDVMALIVAGLANKEVAGQLGINRRTVEAHRATIMKKTGARSLSDLVRFEIAAHAGA